MTEDDVTTEVFKDTKPCGFVNTLIEVDVCKTPVLHNWFNKGRDVTERKLTSLSVMRAIGRCLAFPAGFCVAFIVYVITSLLTEITVVTYTTEQTSGISRPPRTSGSDDDVTARKLAERVRVLCWVMTSPSNIETRVQYVVKTWARRCDKLVIISSESNPAYGGIVGIDVKEGRQHLTRKTLGGFHYVYKHHLNDADWFFKADDDTYVIMENLKYLLSNEDTNHPIYFGHHFNAIAKFDYSSGGSGFVISKEALKRFGKSGSDPKVCRQNGTFGDAAFGECMGNLGVKLKNSTDVFGKTRFHCLSVHSHVTGTIPKWLYSYDANGIRKGVDGLSDYAISFHYVRGNQMETLEYLIYHARPYGVNYAFNDLNQH